MVFDVKVSVIVPVYNVDKYLKKCLDSLINQTLNDIEIICVNDGSTDSSLEILECYANKDSRINVISQSNKGLSGARNTGLKHVKGQYTIFIDSDDWLDLKALELLYNKSIELNLDMLFYQILNFNENNDSFEKTEYGCMNSIDRSFDEKVFSYMDVLDVLFKIPHSAVNKLYKTSFLNNIDAEFPEGLNYEDVLFFFKVFLKASRASILRKPLYFYRIREDSITGISREKSLDIFEILENSKEIINNTDILNTNLQDFLLYLIVNFKFVYSTVSDDYKDVFLNKLKEKFDDFNLDKTDENFVGWHYSDQSFYKSIKSANNHREFDLMREVYEYKFLANYYKNQLDNIENNNIEESKSFKNRFKKILNR